MPDVRDVPGLDAGQWHEILRGLAGSGELREEHGLGAIMARDALRRCQSGLLAVRDMRLVLLATGETEVWEPARRAVIGDLEGREDAARQVLITHTQIEGWPAVSFEQARPQHDGVGGPRVVARAVVGPVGRQVTGPAQGADSVREAQDGAAFALLARMAGVPLPGEGRDRVDRLVVPGLSAEVFEAGLRRAVESHEAPGPELVEEALRRAQAGRLRHRDIHLLLFAARGGAWAPVREAALAQVASMPPAAATLLHQHAEEHGQANGLWYDEREPPGPGERFVVTAQVQAERTWTGPARSAWARRTARHFAACALLAEVAGLPEPAVSVEDKQAEVPAITLPGKGQDPLRYLNKHHQRGLISKPEARMRTAKAVVECLYSCQYEATGVTVRAAGTGRDKVQARQAAALALLRKLRALDSTVAAGRDGRDPAPSAQGETAAVAPVPLQGRGRPLLEAGDRSVQALLEAAVAAGCDVVFTPSREGRAAAWWVRDSGRQALTMTGLPAPLTPDSPDSGAGWWVPVLHGVPAVHCAGTGASASALFWQRLVHIALQLVRAGLVYPALEGRDRAVWRAGPVPPVAEEALSALAAAAPRGAVPAGAPVYQALSECCDAVADALVRSPAAAVFGSGPWTARAPQHVGVEDLRALWGWLDAAEDMSDGAPAPGLILRVQPPSDAQAAAGELTADLHLAAPVGAAPAGGQEVTAAAAWSGAAHVGGESAQTLRPRVRRALRRAARLCPALADLAGQDDPQQVVLNSRAIEALLDHETDLAGIGVRVVWPERLRTALAVAAVIGGSPAAAELPAATGSRLGGAPGGADPARSDNRWAVPVGGRPRFSVTALLHFRWQVALEGVDLSEQEMDALAEAARPLVRIRGQWLLADPALRQRARNRLLGTLPGAEALTAALTGTVTVAGESVACRPAGALADTLNVLGLGEDHPQPAAAPSGLRATLRGYQQRALTWLARVTDLGFGAVLADDMGLGKTLTAIAFILHHQQRVPGPTLVVCPTSLVTLWCREAARFAPDLKILPHHGPDRSLEHVTDTTVVVTTYGVLHRDEQLLAARPWALVIADEAQHAKNHASATARHLRALPAATRLALTGTPVENTLSELWSLLDWTNPGLFGTLKAFRGRWANAAEKDPHGREAAELARLTGPFVLRRLKTDPGIAPELPEKIDTPRLVQLTTEQAGLYEAVVRETMEQITATNGFQRNGLVFKLITALKQITNHPAHYLNEPPPTAAETPAFAARSAKTAALTELLETLGARAEAALIFTGYVTMGRLLAAHLGHLGYTPLFLHGATPLAGRQRIVDAFQSGQNPVMILSVKAAGTGLTLTRATHVIHYDRSWNAAVEDQATDRAHRIGQHRTVSVHRLITEHTIEDRIDELLRQKRALATAVLSGGDRALAQLSNRDLADLVRLEAAR